jgi:hypothetical protein
MNSIILEKDEMPKDWVEIIKSSLGEDKDLVFSPRGYEQNGEVIPDKLYEMSTVDYLNYLHSGGIWSFLRPEEILKE